MKPIKLNLFRQFISIGILISVIIILSVGLFLPTILIPIYEHNIYTNLEKPLVLINENIVTNQDISSVGYILEANNKIYLSSNLGELIELNYLEIIEKTTEKQGKFNHDSKTYYYSVKSDSNGFKIALTDDTYIKTLRKEMFLGFFPLIFATLSIVIILIIAWTRRLVLKIYYLKEKVDNIDNNNYDLLYKGEHFIDDELNSLSEAIDNMHTTLKTQEDYKNQMYQSISHDLKTPITIIKSYLEAYEDKMTDYETFKRIIEEQTSKLQEKVHSLLYLNKLNYLQDTNTYDYNEIDIKAVVEKAIEKFRYENPKLKWTVKANPSAKIYGNYDMWEAIVDNMLNNFIRYAKNKIKVEIKKNEIIFYNDGPNVEENLMNDIFNPYKKGISGRFGLGLSIIKKSLCLMGYGISAKNQKKGVSFIIKESDECKIKE